MKKLKLLFTVWMFQVYNSNAQLHGTSPNWTTPTPLPKVNPTVGHATKGGTGQNLIQLSTGELIQCYLEQYPGSSLIYLLKSTDDGVSWLPAHNPLPTTKTNGAYAATIAKDTSNNIHIVWISNANTRLYYAKLDKNFNVLIDTIRVNQSSPHNKITSPYITVDRKNRVHIMWHDGDASTSSSSTYFAKVMYRRSPNGGTIWDSQQILSDVNTFKHAAFPRANFSGAIGDTLAIPWRQEFNGPDWNVWMAYSTDGGQNWNRINVGSTIDAEWDPGIVVDKNGRIHLHYHEYKNNNWTMSTMEYAYTDNLGVTWTPASPTTLLLSPSNIRSQLSVFAYDYNTNIQCICWKDERDWINNNDNRADIMCSFSTDGGNTWQGQEFICDLDTIGVMFKSVEVGNNNTLYATFEYPDANGKNTIYFTKRQNTTSIVKYNNSNVDLEIYPNPFTTQATLQTDIPLTNATLTVVNIFGQTVAQIKNISGQTVTLQRNDLPSGFYFLQLTEDNNQIVTKKIIIAD